MKTDKLKHILVNYTNPTIKCWASMYDSNKTIIDLRSSVYKFTNENINTIKFQNIIFIRTI